MVEMSEAAYRAVDTVTRENWKLKAELSACRAREQRLREALNWAMDEIDTLSNLRCKFAYPQGISQIYDGEKRREVLDAYRKACDARNASTPPQDVVTVPRELIKDILGSGIEWDPPTKSYLVMQISRDTLTELRASLGGS